MLGWAPFLMVAATLAAGQPFDGGPVPARPDGGGATAPGSATVSTGEAATPPIGRSYPTVAAALHAVLVGRPRVLAVGEYHQTKTTVGVASALARFSAGLLPRLRAAGATDLVVETWITTGACGEVEKRAVAEVDKTTERPKRTENEVVTLLRRAKAVGMQPRILQVACKDYQAMTAGAQVDFDRLLRLTRDQLEVQIRAALSRAGSGLVLSYGGALHNEAQPSVELAPYAFGPAIAGVVGGKYVELDLVVPELVERNPTVVAQPWYAAYRRAYRAGRPVLVRQGQASFVLVFPRSRPQRGR